FSSPACLGGASEIAQAQTGKHISILLPMKILHIYHTIFDSTPLKFSLQTPDFRLQIFCALF
ncbi:MAG: hypothetical protein AB1393_14200, partial [Candidatus Edwardsbacteria bacterium]